jgi:hypothetical protein
MVYKIALGLNLGKKGYPELMEIAFPELFEALGCGLTYIHLILATQRPDANILSGQIKNNVNCRICGRADTILSQIILDSTAAAEQIPKDARGRFLLHDGTLFQAYWFDDRGG